MDINEVIVKEYFTAVLKCFIHENILYKVKNHRQGKKEGGGWSDIDLLAYQPSENQILDIEVKYREKAPFHRGADKASNLDKVISSFASSYRINKIAEFNPRGLPIKKIFATNKKAFREKTRNDYVKLLEQNNIEVIYFEDIFEQLKNHFKKNSNKMTSVIGQILRIVNNLE